MQNARALQQYGQGVPMSSPQELGALAEQRGQLGEQQRGQQERVFSSMPYQAGGAQPANVGALMANLTNNQIGQQANLLQNATQQSLQQRQQALFGANQAAQGATWPAMSARIPAANPAAAFAQLAQEQARQRARQQAMGGAGDQTQGGAPPVQGMGAGWGAPWHPAGGGVQAQQVGGAPPAFGNPFGGTPMGNVPGAGVVPSAGNFFNSFTPTGRTPMAGGGLTPGQSPFGGGGGGGFQMPPSIPPWLTQPAQWPPR